jgi:hypothetical protein
MNDEHLRIWKEVNMSYFKVISMSSSGETEKKSRRLQLQYSRHLTMSIVLLTVATGPVNSYTLFPRKLYCIYVRSAFLLEFIAVLNLIGLFQKNQNYLPFKRENTSVSSGLENGIK